MARLTIHAPLAGWCTSLEEVPDPVFAQRMLGDGLAIDPISDVVIAPCAGEVTVVAQGGHAVSIRTPQGFELLVHVGIDTVQLGGRGFDVRVQVGARVATGDELIRFDLDALARSGKSLMTPIVVTAQDGLEILQRHSTGLVGAGDVLYALSYPETAAPAGPATPGAGVSTRHLTVLLQHGLHARPAALLVQRLRGLSAEVSIKAHGRQASARSAIALMALGVRHKDPIIIEAVGAQAERALEIVAAALEEALRSERQVTDRSDARGPSSDVASQAGASAAKIAAAGYAVGVAARLKRPQLSVTEVGAGTADESAALTRARTQVRQRLTRLGEVGGAARREIVAAHVEFLDDPLLNESAQALIEAGKSAGFAWRTATRESIAALEATADPRLLERVDDLQDVESHVLLALAGVARPMNLYLPERAVLLADDLLPSEFIALDHKRLSAICLAGGGATSHVAILAAAADVPMLVGLGEQLRAVAEGTNLIVDADRGTLEIAPAPAELARAEAHASARRAAQAAERAAAQSECRARDGTRIEVFANIGSASDAAAAVSSGAEGCGLLRTEFLFIDRDTAPDEPEQLAAYQAIADALAGRPLVLRLMDVGGDKPLRYLPLPAEENPALGLRGIRTALWRPDLLRTQLRAALRVQPAGQVQLLLPMITDVEEIRQVRAIVDELRAELAGRIPLLLGAMIETPAAALMAGRIAREVDFLSIGSNDLTQYTLAMDRAHPQLASRMDALHPAVLQLVATTAAAGMAAGKTVAVCGGVAADPAAVPLLLGLGVRELSVVPAAVPAIKRLVRTLGLAECVALAAQCLTLDSAAEIRALVARSVPDSRMTR
ncbi:MAG: phosphoenolpyruvate--protein phosphotransferase [Steroidobacteraceae bacterium]|jgi:phosphoenolpyruvate-protein phosphotransferase